MGARRPACVSSVLMGAMVFLQQPAAAQPAFPGLFTAATPRAASVAPLASEETRKAAAEGKSALLELVKNDDRHARRLGFKSAAEVTNAKVEMDPFPLMLVNLTKLKGFQPNQPGSDPKGLLEPTNEFIYPVTVGEEVRSSIIVTGVKADGQPGQKWLATEIGASKLIQLLDKARRKMKESIPSSSNFVVWIPELTRYFLGGIVGGRFMMLPLVDDPRLKLSVERVESAQDVFAKLVPKAKAYQPGGAR